MNIPHKIRAWDAEANMEYNTVMAEEEIIKNPNGLNLADIGFILLNKARVERGLEPLPQSEYQRGAPGMVKT